MTKRSLALIGGLMFLAACPNDEPTGDPTDDPTPECATVSNPYPAPDDQFVYYRATFSWDFSEADDTASVTLVDGDGNDVSGSGSWVGFTYIWEPTNALQPLTNYTVTLSSCGGENNAETSFRTSDVGGTVADADILGKTYVLDVGEDSSANFIDPPGVGPVLQDAMVENDVNILIGVDTIGAADITMIGALGTGSPLAQDTCYPSINPPAASFSENPYFVLADDAFSFTFGTTTFVLNDLEIGGAFKSDGTGIAGATLAGTVDTRELVPLLAEGGEDTAVCEMAEPFGVFCEACEDGTGDFCLSALVTNIEASEVSGLTLETIADGEEDDCTPATN